MYENYNILHSVSGAVGEYNTTIKIYSNNRFKLVSNSYSSFKGFPVINTHNGCSTPEQLESYRKKHLLEKQEKIRDLAYNYSSWEYFITLTFNDNNINGFDYDLVFKKLSQWLKNQKKSNPDMVYLIVPELHKSGRIHFHGLFANVPSWVLIPAVNPKSGRFIFKNHCQIFNLSNYKLGFTTVSKIKNIYAVSFYISKYMSKELLNIKNRKNIWHSKNLTLPQKKYLKLDSIDNVYELIGSNSNIIDENVFVNGSKFRYFASFNKEDL